MSEPGVGAVVWAAFRQRCPRCREGKMFRGQFLMNDPCPVCGLLFQREEGYFLGAMYFSYALGAAVILPLFFAAQWLLPEWKGGYLALLAWLLYLPFVPAVFRYSRVLWVYLERSGRFTDSTAGSYEKHRLHEIAEASRGRQPPEGGANTSGG